MVDEIIVNQNIEKYKSFDIFKDYITSKKMSKYLTNEIRSLGLLDIEQQIFIVVINKKVKLYVKSFGDKGSVKVTETGITHIEAIRKYYSNKIGYKIKIFDIHNHPSGSWEGSPADKKAWSILNRHLSCKNLTYIPLIATQGLTYRTEY